MENVTEEVSNPFGMRPPCPRRCPGGHRAVFGYGDANAEFHVVGDHPGVHGGSDSGIPFTGTAGGERVLDALATVGLLARREPPDPDNCFLSLYHLCCVPPGAAPTPGAYSAFERFFDAELRAIAADVLLPVGERVTAHVLTEYTARPADDLDMADLHGRQLRGRGFLVVPIREPADWAAGDSAALVDGLETLLAIDYRQRADLGRFHPDDDPYLVR